MRKDERAQQVLNPDEILAMGFDKYQKTFTRTPAPLRPEGKRFLAEALNGNRQVQGKAVLEGKVQSGEFD
jgi:hypothetical protein